MIFPVPVAIHMRNAWRVMNYVGYDGNTISMAPGNNGCW